jgi:hydroxymethylpyrimidine/phosphomethylpyrimidine kinase
MPAAGGRLIGVAIVMQQPPPLVLSIAGSDCSAGAGIQADLKTFQSFGVHGLTAVTCVVSENANVVRAVHPVPVDVVVDQISLMLESFPVVAVKTGMLYSAAHVRAVAGVLTARPGLAVVVDPVMVASTGDPLMEADALDAYRECLFPLARVITPNLPEAEVLLGRQIIDENALAEAACELAGLSRAAVLLKGGHLAGDQCVDLLVEDGGMFRFVEERIMVHASHGTGCTFSAAIAAALARGEALPRAVETAKKFVGSALRHSHSFASPSGGFVHALNQATKAPQNDA